MKKMLSIHVYAIIFSGLLMFNSCKQGLTCDAEDNEKLGEIEYNDVLQYNIEKDSEVLFFEGDSGTIKLPKSDVNNDTPHWWIDHEICESIDVKPYRAYAYYEYENINQLFGNDSTLISIEPQILNDDGSELEVIYINIAHKNQSLKGVIFIDQVNTYMAELDEFESKEFLQVDGVILNNIWILEEDGLGVFYSKQNGVEAIQIENRYYFRSL